MHIKMKNAENLRKYSKIHNLIELILFVNLIAGNG